MGWSPRALLGPTPYEPTVVPQTLCYSSSDLPRCPELDTPLQSTPVTDSTRSHKLLSPFIWWVPYNSIIRTTWPQQREWSAMMVVTRRRWAHIRRNDPWASQGRTPLLVTLRCALPEDTSASDPHRYLHISPHAVCRLHLFIPSSFLFIKPWISPLLWMTYFPISNFVQLLFVKSHGLQFYKKRTSTGKKPHLLFLVRLWFDSKVRKPTAEVPLRRPTR